MSVPQGLYYSETHEWVKVEGETATVGITDFAQSELGDVVYVELPEVGESIIMGDAFGEIESTKAVSDLKSPISGEVIAVNDTEDDHSVINEDPYGAGWLLRVKIDRQDEIANLMDAAAYSTLIE